MQKAAPQPSTSTASPDGPAYRPMRPTTKVTVINGEVHHSIMFNEANTVGDLLSALEKLSIKTDVQALKASVTSGGPPLPPPPPP